MSFGKLHHWAMMGAMILMGGMAALGTHGAATNFLHIAMEYTKQIFVGGFQALGPGLKAMGVAFGNLLSMFGVNPGNLTVVDPSYLMHPTAAPMTTSALDGLHVADKFASAACEPGMVLAPAFGHAAHMGSPAMVCGPAPVV